MRPPNFQDLAEDAQHMGAHGMFYCRRMHPNPRLFKYRWLVFWRGSPCEGEKFFKPKYHLSTKEAFDLIDRLNEQGESYWVYNIKYPRLDPDSPLDRRSKKWRKAIWAVAFDKDTDALYDGFK